MTRQFTSTPAVRVSQHLFIGIVAPSSAGKTWTALELAKGIQSVMGGKIAMVDTENNRGLAYADDFKNADGSPGYIHVPFEPPWGSLDYVDAIKHASSLVGAGGTVIIDSGSHEHDGEGGVIDYQERELTRMAGTDYAKRERMQMLAWAKPKAARRKLLQTITRLDCNVIMCFRAKETSKPGKDGNGKSVVIPMGFMPIAGPEFVYEMSLSILMLPGARGVPSWNPEHPGERIAVKVPNQFKWIMDERGPVTRGMGARMAEWAKGGVTAVKEPAKKSEKPTPAKKPEPAPAPSLDDEIYPWEEWAAKTEEDIDARPIGELRAFWQEAIGVGEWDQLKEHDESRARAMKDRVTRRLAEAGG